MLSGQPVRPVGFEQYRRQSASLEEGFVVAGPRGESYDPMLDKNLPNRFARIRSPEAVRRFVKHYGLLTSPRTVTPGVPEHDREPVDLILRHAESVRMALRLAVAVQEGDKEQAAVRLSPLAVEAKGEGYLVAWKQEGGRMAARLAGTWSLPGGEEKRKLLVHGGRAYAYAAGEGIGLWASFIEDAPPLLDAAYLLAAMVDANLGEVKRSLYVEEDPKTGRPRLGFRFEVRSLLEAIWWHVGERAVTDQLRECLYCGTPFYVTDERMKFCPPLFDEGESQCGDKYRKQRRKKRQKGA